MVAMKKWRSLEEEKFLRGRSYPADEGHDREMERRLSLRVAALNSAAAAAVAGHVALFSLWTGVI